MASYRSRWENLLFIKFGEDTAICVDDGILSKKGENVVPLIEPMLACMANRGPDGAITTNDFIIQSDSLENLRYHKLSGSSALGHLRLAIVGGTCGQRTIWSLRDT